MEMVVGLVIVMVMVIRMLDGDGYGKIERGW